MAGSTASLHPHLALGASEFIIFISRGQLGCEWLNLSEMLAMFIYFIVVLKIYLIWLVVIEVTWSNLKLPLDCWDVAVLSFCVCKELCTIHILIQFGIAAMYFDAIYFKARYVIVALPFKAFICLPSLC